MECKAMHKPIKIFGTFFLLACASAAGQSGPTLTGSGYNFPANVRVAPGQITTLFVTGLKVALSSQPVKATSWPLPVTLSGISGTLTEAQGPQSMPVPVLA